MIYSCCDPHRRSVLAGQTVYNAIDFLEVVDDPGDPPNRQRVLRVHFLHPLAPGQLGLDNVVISGGERIRNVAPIDVYQEGDVSPGGDPRVLVVRVNGPGDFSPYTLSLVKKAGKTEPPDNFDLVLSSIDFSFKVACPATLDCGAGQPCPPTIPQPVNISYLAKDYDSFRNLMLDRLATILPQWQERHSADLGIALIEISAFVGDYLSYQQDAVATEAYLGTARRRTSVRRHVRLVDYPMHDGRNARAWVHFDARSDISGLTVGAHTQLLTQTSQPSVVLPFSSDLYRQALAENPQAFELMEDVTLYAEHNRFSFYTWGDRQCCLPAGSTKAWLRGKHAHLKAQSDKERGDVLLFVEAKSPTTGQAADADPSHRWAMRLASVNFLVDPIGGACDEPPTSGPVEVTEITWAPEDAPPFPLCLSASNGASYYDDVTVALGNNALADHGRTIAGEMLPEVPEPNPALNPPAEPACDRCSAAAPPSPKPARFRPTLSAQPLTFADPYDAAPSADPNQPFPSVYAAIQSRSEQLLPQIQLTIPPRLDVWTAQRDLLHSAADAQQFVAEVEDDGSASLRFQDAALTEGDIFQARYRVGNGSAGNIGADSLYHVASDDPGITTGIDDPVITAATNPLPASGGLDPETIEKVRQSAPVAFRTQQRAVTAEDYGVMALRVDPTLSRAMGTFRWTGSWRTVFISVDPKGSETVDDTRRARVQRGMELYRMAGHDVDVEAPVYVSLEIEIHVCAKPGYLASHVEQALLAVLSNRVLPDGSKGAFHPDNFTFGQPVYLSPIYELVQDTDGVDSLTVTKFQRQGNSATNAVQKGKLAMDRLEIARLDNDPNFPQHGTLTLQVCGGR